MTMTMNRRKVTAPALGTPPGPMRRLIVTSVDDSQVALNDHDQIDLTGLYNNSARDPLMAVIQEQCNLGCWHDKDRVPLPIWEGS
jgi:hypothetical protein